MPVWLQILLTTLGLSVSLLVPLLVSVLLPRLISRKGAEIDKRLLALETDAWSFNERLKLENRLTALETRLEGVLTLMATRVLNNPRGPEPELRHLLVKNLAPEKELTSDELRNFERKLAEIEARDSSLEKRMAAKLLRSSITARNPAHP